jgi:hypothetical protein
LLALSAVVGLLAAAPVAQATFHEISIREVYPGGADNASYVELQMWASGQQFVAGHHLVAYNPNGSVNEDFSFGSSVASGANQATILVADTSYASVFPGKPAADASDANLDLSPAGGAVCWTEGSPPDCVAWGSFTGPLPAHVPALLVGSPASPSGVSAGKALQRTIAPNCATLLEPADDSDSSAADFSEQAPNPRNNASSIPEHACLPPPDMTPPTATIDSHPANPSPGASALFKYHSNEAGSSFECSLASGGPDSFSSCPATGRTYTNLADGTYAFKVRATDKASNQGLPATFSWEVDNSLADMTPPETSIATKPPDPSGSSTAFFTYASNEPGSTFECELDGSSFVACDAGGTTYAGLGAGQHSFQVRAVDPSKNVDPTPASYSFSVVLPSPPPSLLPPTPTTPAPRRALGPAQTTIGVKPAARTRDRTPTFRFRSSAGATFQCKLDGAGFKACHSPFTTKTLSFGTHRIKARAVLGGVPDPTPATYAFRVVRGRR